MPRRIFFLLRRDFETAVALVGADWKAAECRQAGLRALHRSGCALRFRWLCEAVEAGDADAVARELYATNR